MQKAHIHISLLLLLFSCAPPERNCDYFKTGTFTFETLLEGELVTTRFERNDTLEIDFFNQKIDSSKIRWINDCEYIAQKINPKSINEEKALHFKILSTNENYYTFEYSLVGETLKRKGIAQKNK